ncbi:MAG: molybdopterin-dependent oxidoreductase [Planctomycetes bacterium]|nr:molybdopterin-dependent oxidoreductase [Planctomycetota bacterium]
MLGILKAFKETFSSFRKAPVTKMYPYEPPFVTSRSHGAPGLLWNDDLDMIICTGCGACARDGRGLHRALVRASDFLADDALLADRHDGEPITADHGGPLRLVVPRLYAWKSAKWLKSIQLLSEDKPGLWEQLGYHNHGDPWTEERHGW